MADDKFYVNTDQLNDVANDIQALLDKINTDDASKGTYTQFKKASSIEEPLRTFWGSKDPFSDAYGYEFQYVCDTYDALIQQLKNVQQACSQTATKYKDHEKNAKTDVNAPQNQADNPPSGGGSSRPEINP